MEEEEEVGEVVKWEEMWRRHYQVDEMVEEKLLNWPAMLEKAVRKTRI